MSEEKNDTDNFFRDKLEDFEANPPERVWNAIARDLDRKKRARLYWIFGLLFLGAVVSTGSYFYFTDAQQPSAPDKNTSTAGNSRTANPVTDFHQSVKTGSAAAQADVQAMAAPHQEIGSIAEITAKPEQRIPEQKTAVKSLLAMRNTSGQQIAKGSQVISPPAGAFTDERRMRPTTETISHQATDSRVSVASSMAEEDVEEKITQSRAALAAMPDPSAEKEAAESRTGDPEKSALSKSLQPVETGNAIPQEQDVKISEDRDHTALQINQPESVIGSTAASAADAEPSVVAGNAPELAPEKSNLLKRIGSHTSLGIYYSPDLAGERVSGSTSGKPAHAYSWSTGMKMGYSIGSKWRISTGVVYSQFSRKEIFSAVYVASDSEYVHFHHGEGHEGDHDHDDDHHHDHEGGPAHNGNHYVIHTPYGDYDLNELPEECNGEEESGDTVFQVSTVESSFESFSIPLKVRFQLRSRKLGYYIEAGALYSHISGSGSKINTGIFTENGSVNGLNKNYYSALLNLGVEYRFYKGLSFFLEPNLRYSFSPLLEYGSEKTYPFFVGGNLGLAINF